MWNLHTQLHLVFSVKLGRWSHKIVIYPERTTHLTIYGFSCWTHSTLVWGISVINDGLMCLVDVSSKSVRCFKLVHNFLKQNCGQMLFRITRWTLNPKQVMSKGRRGKKKGEGRRGGKILLNFLCSSLHSHGYSTDLWTISRSVNLQGLIWMPEIY